MSPVQETDRCKILHCLECCPVISEAGNSVGDKGFQNNPSERDLLKMVAHLKTGGSGTLDFIRKPSSARFPWAEQQECPCKMVDQKLNSTSCGNPKDITSISLWMVPTMHYWLRWSIRFWNMGKVPISKQLFLAHFNPHNQFFLYLTPEWPKFCVKNGEI